jgi:hypothetical protein
MTDDDRKGKPLSAERALETVSEILDDKYKQLTVNFLRILARERARYPDLFVEYAEGLVTLFSELDETMGQWARGCVMRDRAMHEANS